MINVFKTALEQLEHDLQEVNSNKDALKKNYLELQELRHILTKATHFFEEVNIFTDKSKSPEWLIKFYLTIFSKTECKLMVVQS